MRHDMWKVARKSKGWEKFSVYARLFIHLLHFLLAPKASFKTFSDLARESARTFKCNFYGRRVMINRKFMLRWGTPSVLIPISGDPCHLHQYFPIQRSGVFHVSCWAMEFVTRSFLEALDKYGWWYSGYLGRTFCVFSGISYHFIPFIRCRLEERRFP